MYFSIYPTTGNSSYGFNRKEDFLKEIEKMIDAHIASQGTIFNIEVDSNAPIQLFNKETNQWETTPWGERVL